MLGEDTLHRFLRRHGGPTVTGTMTGDDATWEPAGTVVFIGAEAGGGPSADCCCDYLNFFNDIASARAWTAAHPHVPGQVLTQAEAAALGTRLFRPLLAD